MKWEDGRKMEFIAKTITDVGKAVFVVALVSSFFEKFLWFWRIGITFSSIVFILVGIFIYPAEGGNE